MHPDDLNAIRSVLELNHSIAFAYLYGSSQVSALYNDIDIAVYSKDDPPPPGLSVDLQIALSEKTGKSPDCVFRGKPATDSDRKRPLIPIESGHRFRGKAATL